MQTFRDSHASTDFIPICPSKDFKPSFESHDYSEEFQALLGRLEQEDGNEETNVVAEKKCRRLSVNQVKALERNFELENKLEPKRKLKLAEELGLQPRQVAIWFQNRKARYKTKILERDYGMLKASYDALKLNYVNLEQEREVLSFQLRELKERYCNRMEGRTKVVKELNDSTELKTQNHIVDGDDSSEGGNGKLRGKEEQSVIGNCIHRHHPNL